MKRLFKRNYILLTVLTMLLIFHTDFLVQAAPSETGTLKIHAEQQKGSVYLAVYKVADFVGDRYEFVPEFLKINENLEQEEDKTDINGMTNASEVQLCAEKLCSYVEKENIAPMFQGEIIKDKNFGEIPKGLYLIKQISKDTDLMKVNPVIIEVPYWEIDPLQEGTQTANLVYDVNVTLKEEEIGQTKPEYPDFTEDETMEQETEHHSNIKTGDAISSRQIMVYSILFILSIIAAFETGKRIHRNKRKG